MPRSVFREKMPSGAMDSLAERNIMTAFHSVRIVVRGSILGAIVGFLGLYLILAAMTGDFSIPNIGALSRAEPGTNRYLTIRIIVLVAGLSAGAIIGAIAGATAAVVQSIDQKRHDL